MVVLQFVDKLQLCASEAIHDALDVKAIVLKMAFCLLFVGNSIELQYIIDFNMLKKELQAVDQGFSVYNQLVFLAIDALSLYV